MRKALFFLVIALSMIAGIVSAEEAKEDVPLIGYDGGFFIQNNDRSFVFTTNGRFVPKVYFNKVSGSDSNWSFAIRAARLDLSAVVFSNTTFAFSLEHSTDSEEFQTMNITGAVVTHKFAPEFSVTVGMVGLPLSIISWRGLLDFQMDDAPLIITQIDDPANLLTPLRSSFGSPSGLGIALEGTFFEKLYYNLSVVNGAAKATAATVNSSGEVVPGTGGQESDYDLNFDKRVSVGARIAYDIFDNVGSPEGDIPYSTHPKWTINIGGNYQGKRQDPNFVVMPTINYILTGTAGTAFKWRGFSVSAEMFGRKTKIGDPGGATFYSDILDDMAYYIDTGYFIVPDKLEVVGQASQLFREGPHNNSYQFGGGLNWYPLGKPNIKIQACYSYSNYFQNMTEEAATKSQTATLQFVTSF